MVVDWRKVNEVILNDFQPLTDAQTIFTQVAETRPQFFSSYDVSNSFYQVNLAKESRDLTAYSTKTRHVRFCRAGQGLKSSPSAWLQQIHGVFRKELQSNLAFYMDDGLTWHADFEDHLKFLKVIFDKLRITKLRINPSKSHFAVASTVMLGFKFSKEGVSIDESRFQKIRDIRPARNVKEVKSIMGFFSYFRRHIHRFSIILAAIRELLKKDAPFEWTERHEAALAELKEQTLKNAILEYPDMNETFYIQSDASRFGLAHCLLQKVNGKDFKIISFGEGVSNPTKKF
jgi:Reverse transcriptase (RNA-dependent DNA polymerase)/RNase H-like domain found in reverse transcriptase